jgi:plasmid stabilization system protein ParE
VRPGISLHSQAKLEIRRAIHWYRSKNPGIASRFAAAVDAAMERIAENPYHFPETRQQIRRAFVKGFPYQWEFRLRGERVLVIGCRHFREDLRRMGGEK